MSKHKAKSYDRIRSDDDIIRSVESRDAFDKTWMTPERLSACIARALVVIEEEHPGRGEPERVFVEKCLANVRNTAELVYVLDRLEDSIRESVLWMCVSTWVLDRRILAEFLENQPMLDVIKPSDAWMGDALYMRGSFLMRRPSGWRRGQVTIEDVVPCRLSDWQAARPILGVAFDQGFLTEDSVRRLRTIYPNDRYFASKIDGDG